MGIPATRHSKNFARQLARYGRTVTVDGRDLQAIWTPVDGLGFDVGLGGLAVDSSSPTHYISVLASAFEQHGDNPQGLQVTDEAGDIWTITSTTHEPGDPELRLYLAPDE